MSDSEKIRSVAIEFARRNKKRFAKEVIANGGFAKTDDPVSLFMAGSPGAGKTETAKRLIEQFKGDRFGILHIDPDEYRTLFSAYNGSNSSLFQEAVSIIAESVHDIAAHGNPGYNFIFDGTLANLEKARDNIRRSLRKKRKVELVYVYQDPLLAWNFVVERERKDGRSIPRERFVEQYFAARENVNQLKQEFDTAIQVSLIVKAYNGKDLRYEQNIANVDGYVSERYDRDSLKSAIKSV